MSNGHLRPFAGGLQRPTPDDPCLPWPWHRPTRSTDRVPASGSLLRMADLRPVLLRDRRSRFPVVWSCRLAVATPRRGMTCGGARSRPSPP